MRALPTEDVFLSRFVADTVRLSGERYYAVELEQTRFFREDSLQNFYEYFDGREQLIMNFKMQVGDSLPISREPNTMGYAVCLEAKQVTTFIGTTDTQKTFLIDWYTTAIDEEETFTLQRGVGLYFYQPSFHQSELLVGAIINGVAYGDTTVVSIGPTGNSIPEQFILHQNYPNPFNARTTIAFRLPKAMHIKLTVVDITGRRVATLLRDYRAAGRHQIQWDAKNDLGVEVASGVYLVALTSEGFTEARKMLLLR